MINYGKQHIDSDDIKAVIKVLRGDWITQGRQIEKFESALKFKFGAKFCKVLSNGTAALHLAGLALGWKKGDIILTTPISFLSTANCILYSGATPDFVDINNYSYNIDPNKLADKIKNLNFLSNKVVAIVATDYAGYPCDWKAIKSISRKYDVKLINDNSHALGASYNNDTQYAAKYADIVTHSSHPVKHITAGEGGAITTNNEDIYHKLKLLRSHGVYKDDTMKPWEYEMRYLGFNYRITDIQCALALSQLKKLDSFIERRYKIAKEYDKAFSNTMIRPLYPYLMANSSYHLYIVRVDFESTKTNKDELFRNLREQNIGLQLHYIPINTQPYYRSLGYGNEYIPMMNKYYKECFSLPMYPLLSDEEQKYTIGALKENLN